MYQYFIKVVPTLYRRLNNETMGTNQFAVTKHQRAVRATSGEHGLPGYYYSSCDKQVLLSLVYNFTVK